MLMRAECCHAPCPCCSAPRQWPAAAIYTSTEHSAPRAGAPKQVQASSARCLRQQVRPTDAWSTLPGRLWGFGLRLRLLAAVLGQVQGRLRKTQTGPWKTKEISKGFVGYAKGRILVALGPYPPLSQWKAKVEYTHNHGLTKLHSQPSNIAYKTQRSKLQIQALY